jgi:hypothetical protein
MHLDYLSCLLTILSTIMVGRRMWQGWLVAGANSVIICIIGLHTGQWGFVPANLFCLAIYCHNVMHWRQEEASPAAQVSGSLTQQATDRAEPGATRKVKSHRVPIRARSWREWAMPRRTLRSHGNSGSDDRFHGNRVHRRRVSNQRESRTSV